MQALRGAESCCKFTTRLVIVNRSHYSFATCQVCDEPTSGDGRDEDVEHKQPALLITSTCRSDSLYQPASGRGISMRVKSNKALHGSARLARRGSMSSQPGTPVERFVAFHSHGDPPPRCWLIKRIGPASRRNKECWLLVLYVLVATVAGRRLVTDLARRETVM